MCVSSDPACDANTLNADTSSKASLGNEGWTFDFTKGEGTQSSWDASRPDGGLYGNCGGATNWFGMSKGALVGTLTSPTLQGCGTATVEFGNCWNAGSVNLYLNGEHIDTAETDGALGGPTQLKSFSFQDGDYIQLKDEGSNSAIRFKSFSIQCDVTCAPVSPTSAPTPFQGYTEVQTGYALEADVSCGEQYWCNEHAEGPYVTALGFGPWDRDECASRCTADPRCNFFSLDSSSCTMWPHEGNPFKSATSYDWWRWKVSAGSTVYGKDTYLASTINASFYNPDDHYVGCFSYIVRGADGMKAVKNASWNEYFIVSPTTNWGELGTFLYKGTDSTIVAAADVSAGEYKIVVTPEGLAKHGATGGMQSDNRFTMASYLVVSRAEDIVPAAIQHCKNAGSKYANVYQSARVYCSNTFGQLTGLAPIAFCAGPDPKDQGVTLITADRTCQEGFPCGDTSLLSEATYATGDVELVDNAASFNATKASMWLKSLSKDGDSLAGEDSFKTFESDELAVYTVYLTGFHGTLPLQCALQCPEL